MSAAPALDRADELEALRGALTAYCARMLGSPAEGEDAAQEALVRAWRGLDRFAGDCSLRSWLYRIATNVCVDQLRRRRRVVGPVDVADGARPTSRRRAPATPEVAWVVPDPAGGEPVARECGGEAVDPAATAVARDDVRLACLTALQVLPARQRAALVLCEVLRWRAADAAELLGASEASVTSALQRARVTLAEHRARRTAAAPAPSGPGRRVAPAERRRADRCADAFATQDLDSLLALLG